MNLCSHYCVLFVQFSQLSPLHFKIPFLKLVADLTGKELSGDPWTAELKREVSDVLKAEHEDYEKAIKEYEEAEQKSSEDKNDIDLGMTVRFVDGDTVISDSSAEGKNALTACKDFELYVTEIKEKKNNGGGK